MQALLGAGGGDVEEARGLDVLGVGVEVAEVAVGGVVSAPVALMGASSNPPLARARFPPCQGGEPKPTLLKSKQIGSPPPEAVEAGDDDGVELEALGLVDGHDLEGVVGGVDVGQRVEARRWRRSRRGEVDGARLLQALRARRGRSRRPRARSRRDAGGAAEREPGAFDAVAQAAAHAVGERRGRGCGLTSARKRSSLISSQTVLKRFFSSPMLEQVVERKPHQGARRRESQAMRSPRCRSARVSA